MSSNTHLSIHSKTKSSKDNVSNSLSAAKNPSTESKSQILQFLSTREPLSYAEHIRLLESELDKNKLKQDAQDYLKQLKLRKLEESSIRKQRELDRRKFLSELQKKEEEKRAKDTENEFLMRLSMKSKQERRIAEQLYKVRQQKEVIKTNRLIRENLYEHQRQKDFEEAINKEIIKSEKMHQEYHEQSLLLKQQYQSFVEKRKKKKHEKRIIMCSQIVDQLLEFSFKISEYKEFNDGKVPPSLIRECKTLFLNLKPITSNYNTEPMVDRVEPIPTIEIDPPPELIKSIPLELDPAVKVIDEEEFKQYVTGNGVWSFKTEAPPINAHLGTIISQILSYSQGDEKNRLVDPLPPLPLKLCLIGKPCSGKNSLSIRFTTHFDIKVYTADGIVQQTLHLLRDSPEEMDSKLLEMGQQAFQSLSSGNEVEDEVLTALVAHTLRQTKNSGFLLVGFPRTRLQAQLLEKELTGYEEMKPIKPGNLKRTGSSNPKQTKSLQKVKSLVAPDLVSSETPPTSHTGCFDAVVLLQMDVDTAVKRLTRKRIDPETNSIYLLDENPPPTNEIGIHDRLIPVDESKVGQIHIKMALFDEEIQKLGEWYSKIGNYMVIDASGSQDETWKLFENLVLELKEKKKNIETSPNPTTGGLVTSFGQSEIPKELDPEKEAVKEVELDKENDKERERDGEKEKEKEREKEKENVKDVEREKEKEGEKLKEKNIPEDKKKTPSSPKALPQSPLKKVSPELPKPVNVPAFTLDTLPEAYKHELKIEPSLKMMKVFADEWSTIEMSYTNVIKYLFRCLRREREELLHYFFETKQYFEKFLKRPDNKQALVQVFQDEFNEIEDDLRSDLDAKAEFHQRTEDLKERLHAICDERKDQAEIERTNIILTKFIEEHFSIISECYMSMIQCELDRYLSTRYLILDYARESNGILLEEAGAKSYTLPKSPPSNKDENTLKISNSIMNIRREQVVTSKSKGSSDKSEAKNKRQSSNSVMGNKGSNDEGIDVWLSEFNKAQEAAFSYIQSLEEEEKKFLRDFKSGLRLNDSMESDENNEYIKAIRGEESLLRFRFMRICDVAVENLKEVRNRSIELYSHLDDRIGVNFRGEIAAVKNLVVYVKQAIELELKLPNELCLNGQEFKIDLSYMMFEPEPPPNPPSPKEELYPDKFTVQQLKNLVSQFKTICNDRFISVKQFFLLLKRFSNLPDSFEYLPSSYTYLKGSNDSIFNDLVSLLDPYDTGYVSWKKFIVFASRILPAPESQIHNFRKELERSPSGFIPYEQFLNLSLWFETADFSPTLPSDLQVHYNPAYPLKSLFADTYEVFVGEPLSLNGVSESSSISTSKENRKVDLKSFASICCSDENFRTGLCKAFTLIREDGGLTIEEIYQTLNPNSCIKTIYSKDWLDEIPLSAGVDKENMRLNSDDIFRFNIPPESTIYSVQHLTSQPHLCPCLHYKYEEIFGDGRRKSTQSTTSIYTMEAVIS